MPDQITLFKLEDQLITNGIKMVSKLKAQGDIVRAAVLEKELKNRRDALLRNYGQTLTSQALVA